MSNPTTAPRPEGTPPTLPELLAQWRATRTGQMLLKCGLMVTLRKVTVLELAAQGRIPTPLHGQAQALINATQSISLTVDRFPEWAGVVNLIVKSAVVSPPVADEADDEHIGVEELPVDDRLAIFRWAQEEAAQLATFLG